MKQRSFLTVLWLICCFAISAQTQQGFVKTKGRLGSNVQVIHGTPLSGVMVTVKGRNSVVSGQDGKFLLVIPDNNYYLQSVQKKDYVLVDPDVLSKQYFQSKNQLVLVLEDKAQQEADRRAVERKISGNLYAQLQKRNDELEALKEQHKITEEKYHEMLEQLNRDQDDNEKIIKDMVERYSKIDFDQIDEFNRRVSDCIINGRLMEADSLLRTKGDINIRIRELNRHHNANKQKRTELERSEASEKKNRDDIAQDCYSKFEIFKMRHQNDSAAYYIQLHADLDCTNVDWQNETGLFVQNYLANYELARFYYLRALHAATGYTRLPMEEFLQQNPRKTENCWNNLGYLEEQLGDIDKSIMAYIMARTLWEKVLDKKSIEYVRLLTNMGVAYKKKGDYSAAKNLYYEALDSLMSHPGYYEETITLCNNLGSLYLVDDVDKALNMFQMAQEQQEKYFGDSTPNLAVTYGNIAICKLKQKNIKEALEYAEKANRILTKLYGRNHPISKNIQMIIAKIKSESNGINHN